MKTKNKSNKFNEIKGVPILLITKTIKSPILEMSILGVKKFKIEKKELKRIVNMVTK